MTIVVGNAPVAELVRVQSEHSAARPTAIINDIVQYEPSAAGRNPSDRRIQARRASAQASESYPLSMARGLSRSRGVLLRFRSFVFCATFRLVLLVPRLPPRNSMDARLLARSAPLERARREPRGQCVPRREPGNERNTSPARPLAATQATGKYKHDAQASESHL